MIEKINTAINVIIIFIVQIVVCIATFFFVGSLPILSLFMRKYKLCRLILTWQKILDVLF